MPARASPPAASIRRTTGWAISACLLEGAAITGREDFARRAGVYLGEGLDIDESGEFAERSTGVYNLVNDDQMLRLYHLTGDRQYLEAAAQNLRMMRRYFDPDGSVFTFNSRRQDFGATVWPEGYCSLYLLTGFWMKDADFAATALYLARICTAHGTSPSGLPWLLRWPGQAEFAVQGTADIAALTRYSQVYTASGIASGEAVLYAPPLCK